MTDPLANWGAGTWPTVPRVFGWARSVTSRTTSWSLPLSVTRARLRMEGAEVVGETGFGVRVLMRDVDDAFPVGLAGEPQAAVSTAVTASVRIHPVRIVINANAEPYES